MIGTLLLLALLAVLMFLPPICLIYMIIFDEPEPPCYEVPHFEELPQSAELKRCEIDYEHSRCIKDGVQIVTLWWLIDVDGLQMQKDGTVKHIGRRDSPWQAENHFWQGTIQTPGDYTKTMEVHGPQTTVTRLAKMRCCGRDEDGYLIFDDYPEYETVTDIAGNKTIYKVY